MHSLKPNPPYRQVEKSDVGVVYGLVREFYRKQGEVYGIAFDPESSADTIAKLIAKGILIRGNRSCAGAFVAPFPYNHSALVAHVMFWYFKSPREINPHLR